MHIEELIANIDADAGQYTPMIDDSAEVVITERAVKARTRRHLESLQFRNRIVEAMLPYDPKDFEYRDECYDCGPQSQAKCACGHPIRYEFVVRHRLTNHRVPIGSVCIVSTIPSLLSYGAEELASSLAKALKKVEDEKQEAERRARDSKAASAVQELSKDYKALRDWFKDCRNVAIGRCQWLPGFLYWGCSLPATVPACSTPGRTAASLKKRMANFYREASKWVATAEARDMPALPTLGELATTAIRPKSG